MVFKSEVKAIFGYQKKKQFYFFCVEKKSVQKFITEQTAKTNQLENLTEPQVFYIFQGVRASKIRKKPGVPLTCL